MQAVRLDFSPIFADDILQVPDVGLNLVLKNQAVALQAYKYMRLVSDAIRRAGSDDRQKIRDAMEATKDWPIAIGPAGTKLTYSPSNHDLFTSADEVVLREVKNGEFGPALKLR